jgi:hypothetical protein
MKSSAAGRACSPSDLLRVQPPRRLHGLSAASVAELRRDSVGIARHPSTGRPCVQAIRDAPIDPTVIQRSTMTVGCNSPNLRRANEMRVS